MGFASGVSMSCTSNTGMDLNSNPIFLGALRFELGFIGKLIGCFALEFILCLRDLLSASSLAW